MNMKATRIKNSIAFAKSIMWPTSPLYDTSKALMIVTSVRVDSRVIKHSLNRRHIVTAFQARNLIKADYDKHPSKKRIYQIHDLQQTINNGQFNYYSYGYVKDPTSWYKRMACEPVNYEDVMGVIDDIETAYPQLQPVKKQHNIFADWDAESRKHTAKVATPF